MATRDAGVRGGVSRVFGAAGRVTLIGLFTGIETVALVVWLALAEDAPIASEASAIGLTVLATGLTVEHFLTDQAVNGLDFSFPVGRGIAISLSETALWAAWLLVAERVGGLEGVLFAGGVLAVLLVPQHTIEDNVLGGRGLFASIVDLGTVGFSLVEAAGATVWLLFVSRPEQVESMLLEYGLVSSDPAVVGVGILAATLFVEHLIGVAFSRRT